MKILNLYAGIGGNRKLWGDEHQITAVEIVPEIAAIYKDFFPNDEMIIGDAHQYLLDHFQEYDFIWSSPPCPTHSRLNNLHFAQGHNLKYPDMTLYQQIILLKSWFNGKYCVENVISYYDPLIQPTESNSHYYWTNFKIRSLPNKSRQLPGLHRTVKTDREGLIRIDLSKFKITKSLKKKVINNCVEPETALHILNCAMDIIQSENVNQLEIF